MNATTHHARGNLSVSSMNILFGLWLIIAPFVLGYSRFKIAMWNDIILGVLIGIFALVRSWKSEAAMPSWINVLGGIWLIIAPFVLDYGIQTTPRWNDIILGILVIIFAWSNHAAPQPHPRVQ